MMRLMMTLLPCRALAASSEHDVGEAVDLFQVPDRRVEDKFVGSDVGERGHGVLDQSRPCGHGPGDETGYLIARDAVVVPDVGPALLGVAQCEVGDRDQAGRALAPGFRPRGAGRLE